jgi:hypothetical protein
MPAPVQTPASTQDVAIEAMLTASRWSWVSGGPN